jgi:hypothetical protein
MNRLTKIFRPAKKWKKKLKVKTPTSKNFSSQRENLFEVINDQMIHQLDCLGII